MGVQEWEQGAEGLFFMSIKIHLFEVHIYQAKLNVKSNLPTRPSYNLFDKFYSAAPAALRSSLSNFRNISARVNSAQAPSSSLCGPNAFM